VPVAAVTKTVFSINVRYREPGNAARAIAVLRHAREFVAHFSFHDIKNHLEADMNKGMRDSLELLD